jgi:DNA-binding NarL/FixJ family response regulator
VERPDICLLDVDLPGGGIRAASELETQLPGAAVVMLGTSCADGDLLDAVRAGAVGYLVLNSSFARLPQVLRGVLAGEAAVPRTLVLRLVNELHTQGRRRRLTVGGRCVELTCREWEVLTMMHEGLSTVDTAQRLFVSPVTVRRHVSAVVRKLGVQDREAALRLMNDFV